MTTLQLQKKLAPILPKGKKTLERFMKDALLLQLQEVSKKIAVFEARYNSRFSEFKLSQPNMNPTKRYSYENESDYFDWEALESYKLDIMRVMHSL